MSWLIKQSDLAAGQSPMPPKPYIEETPLEATSDIDKISDDPTDAHIDNPACPTCAGVGLHLGQLGKLDYFRCEGCGEVFS